MLYGIDIASHQWDLDLSKVQHDFVIIKATGGPSYVNPYFNKHIEQALSLGKLVGAYHFALDGFANQGPQVEARNFVNKVKPYLGKIILALDWEAKAVKLGPAWAKAWLDEVYNLTGVHPILYVSHSLTADKGWAEVAKYTKLWMAQYKNYNPSKGYNPNPWGSKTAGQWGTNIFIRQYTSMMYLDGWRSHLDANLLYGTREEWLALAKVGATPAPEPTPEPTPEPAPSGKTYNELAREVLAGKWGNGGARVRNLTEAGYNASEVQRYVNAIYSGRTLPDKVAETSKPSEPSKPNKPAQSEVDYTALAREVWAGKWGNGAVRRRRLTEAGYDYDKVQAEVNRLYG